MGKPSVVWQVETALKTIFVPGSSKYELDRLELEKRIVGIRSMRDYTAHCCRFARWCQAQYGVRYIGQITPAMAQAYVEGMRDRELSGGYIGAVQCAIRKLDAAMREHRDKPQSAPPLLPLDDGRGWHSDRRPERAYDSETARRIIIDMQQHARDKQTASVVEIQLVAGLRVTEAVMLRGRDIDVEHCTVHVVKGPKGGRERVVQVDVEHRTVLEKLKEQADRHRDGHVFQDRGELGQGLVERTQEAVRQACQRLKTECFGTHGFRKTLAQQRHQAMRSKGVTDREARQQVSHDLGHNRMDVTYSYIPR